MLLQTLTALLTGAAHAADPVDIGIIRDEDITVVQKLLYPKDDRTEVGLHLGVMPFDAYLTTPNAQLSFGRYFSEKIGFSLVVGGGYGFKTATYRELESPTIGVAPYAFRYLGSALAGLEWSPVYAKLNWGGGRVVHFDVYFAGRFGASLEQSVIPSGGIAVGPTLSPGVGGRFFLGKRSALKVEIRDDLLLEYRTLVPDPWKFKQNANVTLGWVFLSAVKE